MKRPLTLALVASILLVSPVLGAASSPASETLTVSATTTLTGVPASIAYGASLAGNTVTSGSAMTWTASSNNGAGFTVNWAATNLTTTGGTIAAVPNRYLLLTGAGTGCATVGALSGYTTAPGMGYNGPAGSPQAIVNRTSNGTCAITGVVLSVTIPAGAVAGAYTGTTTISVVES
jgi:hypothetical protein